MLKNLEYIWHDLLHTGLDSVVIFLWCISIFTGCSGEQNLSTPEGTEPETLPSYSGIIVALGDSLTAGQGVPETQSYPAKLEARLLSDGYNYKVINAGVSGETSSGTLSRIDWVRTTLKPDIIILVTGANDGLRGIDTRLLNSNLDKLIFKIKKHPIRIILGGMKMLPNLGPAYAKDFENVYPEIAEKHGVILVPFFLEGVAGEAELNQSDGIHPTSKGYSIIVDHLYPYVLETIENSR